MDSNLLERLARVTGDLPSMPEVVERVMKLVQDPETDVEDLRRVIQLDPGLSAKILKVANSAFYRRTREIASLNHAILTLGYRTVLSLALASSVKSIFDRHSNVARQTKEMLWNHSISTAFVTVAIGRAAGGVDVELGFIGGLLHDIGKVVISQNFPMQFNKIRHAVSTEGASESRVEEELLGFRHEELGAYLAREWKLPESLEGIIYYHHCPATAPSGQHETAAVHVADLLCTELGWNFPRPDLPKPEEALRLVPLGIDAQTLTEIREDVAGSIDDLKAIF